MDLSKIKNTGKWDSSAASLNENFSKVGTEVDKLKYAAYNSKLYATEALLKQAVPNPSVGDWAIVGDTIPGEIYRCDTDGEWTATGQTGGGYGMEVTEKHVTEQYVTEVHNEYTGDIVNNPDDEDLISEEKTEGSKVLKLADKLYNASVFSGMGRCYLRKNISEGKNVLTQAMMDKANTRYIIQYDYDLNGETVTVPEGCMLDFQGGSLKNGKINGNSTTVSASYIDRIFSNIELLGTFVNDTFSVKWFGANGTYVEDYNSKAIDEEDDAAFKMCVEAILNQKRGFMYIPKGVYGVRNIIFNPKETENFFGLKRGSTFGIRGEGSLSSVLVFQGNSDGVYYNPENKSLTEVYMSDFQIYGKSNMWDFSPHKVSDYVNLSSNFSGDNIGLLLVQSGYKSNIRNIHITGFRIGFANVYSYGGPNISNIYVDYSGIGYYGYKNTTVMHQDCTYNGYESGYLAFASSELLSLVVSEGNLKTIYNLDSSDLVAEMASRYNGDGFSFYSLSRITMLNCYTEYLFGASRKIISSFVEDISGNIGNTIYYFLTTDAARQGLKDYIKASISKFPSIYFKTYIQSYNSVGSYNSKNCFFDISEDLTDVSNIYIDIVDGTTEGTRIIDAYKIENGKYVASNVSMEVGILYRNPDSAKNLFNDGSIVPKIIIPLNNSIQNPISVFSGASIYTDDLTENHYNGYGNYFLGRRNINGQLQTENYEKYTDGTDGFYLGVNGVLNSVLRFNSYLKKADEITKTNHLFDIYAQSGKIKFNHIELGSKPDSPENCKTYAMYFDKQNHGLVTVTENLKKFIDSATGSTYAKKKGTTSQRPAELGNYPEDIGAVYMDTTLKKYIMWNGTEWRNLDGTTLD